MKEDDGKAAPVAKKKGPSPESLRREKIIAEETQNIQIPEAFELTRRGVKSVTEGIHITSAALWVSHLVRNEKNRDWAVVIRGFNRNGELIDVVLGYDVLFGRASQVAAALAAAGFHIRIGVEKLLALYINGFVNVPKLISANRIGWVTGEDGSLGFNLPDQTLGDVGGYDLTRLKGNANLAAMCEKGDLKGWITNVAQLARKHPFLRFGLAHGLTGPLLKLLDAENFGIQATGPSSTAKSTFALIICSMWGSANRPGAGPTLMLSFNATANALENLCESRNDTVLIFDEVGSHDGSSFTTTVYRIAGGVQKGRLGRDGNLRECSEWQFTFVTTGERSVFETLSEDQREGRVRSGQGVRLLNLSTENRIIVAKDQAEATEIVTALRVAMNEQHGTAGRAFVTRLIHALRDKELDLGMLRQQWDQYLEAIMVPNLENHQVRALRHLALVGVAGQLAIALDVLPYTDEEIFESIELARDMYLGSEDMLGDAAREAVNIRDFIEENRDRFRHYVKASEPVRGGQVGYQYELRGESFFLFTRTGLGRAAKARNLKGVLKFLHEQNLIHTNNTAGKFQARIPYIDFTQSRFGHEHASRDADGKRRQASFYCISESLLTWDGAHREAAQQTCVGGDSKTTQK